jgi:signal transduction histidine kinase
VQETNSHGAWNEQGVALQLRVLPPWWGAWWFRSLVLVLLSLTIGSVAYLRLRAIEQHAHARLEERVGERTRIARELHDTLLQRFHAVMFQLQAARNMLPRRPEDAMQTLDGAIIRAEQAVAEGRDAIQNLRAIPVAQTDLDDLLNAMGQELAGAQDANRDSATFQMATQGLRRTLAPEIQDELHRIGCELLQNAFRHAQASRIKAEVFYSHRDLRLRIRDNGAGIGLDVLHGGGRAGHWGLPGVRERAEGIGARLEFRSEPATGTEVSLTVPASVAYGTSRDARGFTLLRKEEDAHERQS